MFGYIAKIRRGTAIVDIIIIIGGTEVLFDSIFIIGYNTISDRDPFVIICFVVVVVVV